MRQKDFRQGLGTGLISSYETKNTAHTQTPRALNLEEDRDGYYGHVAKKFRLDTGPEILRGAIRN